VARKLFLILQREMVNDLVQGCAYIDIQNVNYFQYNLEIFHGCHTLLSDIIIKISGNQKPLPGINQTMLAMTTPDDASKLIAALTILFCFLKKCRGNLNPEDSVMKYCNLQP